MHVKSSCICNKANLNVKRQRLDLSLIISIAFIIILEPNQEKSLTKVLCRCIYETFFWIFKHVFFLGKERGQKKRHQPMRSENKKLSVKFYTSRLRRTNEILFSWWSWFMKTKTSFFFFLNFELYIYRHLKRKRK